MDSPVQLAELVLVFGQIQAIPFFDHVERGTRVKSGHETLLQVDFDTE